MYVSDEEVTSSSKKEAKVRLKVVNEKTGKTLSKSRTKFTIESPSGSSSDSGEGSSVLIIPTSLGHQVKLIKCSDFLWTSTSGTSETEKTWIQASKNDDFFIKQEESSCKRRLSFYECAITLKTDSNLKWNNVSPKVIYSAF